MMQQIYTQSETNICVQIIVLTLSRDTVPSYWKDVTIYIKIISIKIVIQNITLFLEPLSEYYVGSVLVVTYHLKLM